MGENLGLKAERSFSPKSSFMKKPYRPGQHGKARRRAASEYGTQLLEKQKVKISYGINEHQLGKYFKEAKQQKGVTANLLLSMLEKRLDNVVYRAGLAPSRIIARQLVSHGHFLVNGIRVKIPSYRVKTGEVVTIRPQSRPKPMFSDLVNKIKKHEAPSWLEVEKKDFNIRMKTELKADELPKNFNMNTVVAFYSR